MKREANTLNESPPGFAATSSARAELATAVHVDVDWAQQELFFRREVAKIFGRSLDAGEGVKEMFHLLSEFLGLNRGRLYLHDPDTGCLRIRCAYGMTCEEVTRGRLQPGEGITGRVFQSGQSSLIQDIDAEPNYLWRSVKRSDLPVGTIAVFSFPIRVNGRMRGVFSVNRFRAVSRSLAADLEILSVVVTQISQLLRFEELVDEVVRTQTAALRQENKGLKEALDGRANAYGVIGESLKTAAVIRQIEQIAPTDATVLLLGESGTGKELFANAIHQASRRKDGPLIKLNCGAIPDALFEAELFGYEKGAFTGASGAKPGRFEEADGGTLFLDEIGDLPLAMQVKLLRALQDRSVMRVGGRRERPIDVRIVAATNLDLGQLVAAGRFRSDLYYRLHVMPIRLAPLRERPDDIAPLVKHFLAKANRRFNRSVELNEDALAQLVQYAWPGNVRQLQNLVDRLVLLSEEDSIDGKSVAIQLAEDALPAATQSDAAHAGSASPLVMQRRVMHEDLGAIQAALLRSGGVKSRAAQQLGLTLSQLNYRIKTLGIQG